MLKLLGWCRKQPFSNQPLTLRHNFSWTFVGNFVYAGCQWGMLVVIAKLGTPEMVGQFTLGLAVTAPILLLFNLQLRALQATDVHQRFSFADYFGLRLLTTFLALLFIAGFVLFGGYHSTTAIVILLIGVAKAIESISDVVYGRLQQHERMDCLAQSMMIRGTASLVALGVSVYLSHSVVLGTFSLVVVWAIVLLWFDIPKSQTVAADELKSSMLNSVTMLHSQGQQQKLLKLAWMALPMGFVMMLISLNVNIPRYFIEQQLGQRELGIFAAITYLQIAGNTVISALGQSATPRLAKLYIERANADFQTLLLKLIAIASLFGGIGIGVASIAGHAVLSLLYRPEYAEQSEVFIWVMVASAIGYVSSVLGYGMTAARYFKPQLPLFAFVALAIASLSVWLIPTQGLHGAAIVLVIGALVQFVGSLGILAYALRRTHHLESIN